MLALIILVLISLIVVSYFVAEKQLNYCFLDLDVIYFQFLEAESNKLEIKSIVKKQIEIEQKIKNNNKVIKINNKNIKPVYIKGCGYVTAYLDKPSAFEIWKAEALNNKYKKEWKELRLKNIKLSNKIK